MTMTALRRCEQAGCEGHPGKFADCLSEIMHNWSVIDPDAEAGSDEYGGHLALVLVPTATLATDDEVAGGHVVGVDAGGYLVYTFSTGAVAVQRARPSMAQKAFQEFDDRYQAWLAGGE